MNKAKSVKSATAGQSGSDEGMEANASVWSTGVWAPASVRECEGRMSICVEYNNSNTMVKLDALHSKWKGPDLDGKASIGAEVTPLFSTSKACCLAAPHHQEMLGES